jgi:hypothetical protein
MKLTLECFHCASHMVSVMPEIQRVGPRGYVIPIWLETRVERDL